VRRFLAAENGAKAPGRESDLEYAIMIGWKVLQKNTPPETAMAWVGFFMNELFRESFRSP